MVDTNADWNPSAASARLCDNACGVLGFMHCADNEREHKGMSRYASAVPEFSKKVAMCSDNRGFVATSGFEFITMFVVNTDHPGAMKPGENGP